jgi:hypothetical protein
MLIKQCRKCNQEKTFGEFTKNKSTSDGLSLYCKICTKSYNGQKYNEDKSKFFIRVKKWQKKNPEKTRNITKKYYKLNPWSRIMKKLRGDSVEQKGIKSPIGKTPTEFRQYIESLWQQGMSWENYGKYWCVTRKIKIFQALPEELPTINNFSNIMVMTMDKLNSDEFYTVVR